ncbi:hypothetical protein NLX86_07620 [Streptomyces sp. A3M-1-3]|uniref:hypothetical protein n=1 Tax=Streptomyces sp. A3M-1-3 TaxID=2962044 RepID=UPI0020B8B1F2|nr:hypothetical protein [Streptomyces sp. A3M-1-3]MCP3817995.1 hypothetical protein [Streptomyces sp. A3M-1-3]
MQAGRGDVAPRSRQMRGDQADDDSGDQEQGQRPPDALIAATALANGWTLVSRNIKHLARSGALLLNPWEYEG